MEEQDVCGKVIPQVQLIGTEQFGWQTFCRRPKHHPGECAIEPTDDDKETVALWQ